LVRQARGGVEGPEANGLDLHTDPTPITPVRRASTTSAYVDIIFGCNFNCTYCAVPSARGREVSRSPRDILDEVRQLCDLGYREITLLGQTVNAYGHDLEERRSDGRRFDFAWLLEAINDINPKLRVRFTSPHPMYFNQRLVEVIADLPSVCEHLHMPLQSGSNSCLKRMKRTYTIEKYRAIIDSVREKMPNVAVTTDTIVGFCGETEAEFEETQRAFEEIRFDQAFLFAYSPRHSTQAWDWEDDVPASVKQRRLSGLIARQNEIARDKNRERVGERVQVLVEGPSDNNAARLCGRTRQNKLVMFDGAIADYPRGSLVEVDTREAFLWGFVGDAVQPEVELDSPARPRLVLELPVLA
jgi:tRNA-2-methylthio-N6-dimethylallyladenosine synthase